LGAVLIWLSLASGTLPAAGGAAEPHPGAHARKNTLANGLTWIYQNDTSSATSSLFVLVGGGQDAEPLGKGGLAYLVTRLAVEIPDEGKARDLMIRATRMSVAVFEDCSMIGVQCLSENFEDALKTLGGMLRDPLLNGIRIDAIRENMKHLGRIAMDDSANAAHAGAMRLLFGPSGRGGPAWGTEETLDAIRKKDVQEWFRAHFAATNMIVSVASDLDEGTISGFLGKYFGGLEKGAVAESVPPAEVSGKSREVVLEKTSAQAYLGLGFPLPPLSRRNHILACIVDDVLGGGIGSRLWDLRFRDRLAYSFNSAMTYPKGPGFIEVYLETSPGKITAARGALERIVDSLASEGLRASDLENAAVNAASGFLRAYETKDARARSAALFEFRGLDCDFAASFAEEIRSVGLDEINAFVRSVMARSAAVEVRVGPKTDQAIRR
jgi:zinc protease